MASEDGVPSVPRSDSGKELSIEEDGGSAALAILEHRLEEAEDRVMATLLEDEDADEDSVGSDDEKDPKESSTENEKSFERSESLLARCRLTQAWAAKYVAEVEAYIAKSEDEQETSIVKAVKEFLAQVYEDDPEMHAQQVIRISKAVEKNAGAKTFVLLSGCIALISHIMAVHRSSAKVQTSGCHLLELVAEDSDQIQNRIGGWEGIDAVLDAMTTHIDNVEVQTAASGALRTLTWAERNRETMLRHGAMQDLVQSMTTHLENAKLQEHVSGTIAHVVFGNHDSKKLCGTVGGVKAILDAMHKHPDVVSLQAQCCFALRNLSWDCKENHALMHEIKASDLIADAMRRHPRIPGIQDQGLAALSNLLFRDVMTYEESLEESSNASKQGLGDHSLQGLAFSALQSFSKNISIVRHAQSLLINLCDQLRTDHSKELQGIATHPNAAKLICKTAYIEGAVVEIPKNASKLMKVMCPVDDFLVGVRENGGLEVLLLALDIFVEGHPNDAAVIIEGLNAACSGSDESKSMFNKLGGVGKVAAHMLKVPKCEKFQERCCALLDIVSNGQFEATAINMENRPDAIRSVLAAMVIYIDSASLQEHGCSVMIKVAAASESDSNELCEVGAKPVVEKARSTHHGNPAVESLANQLLTLLVPNGDTSREGRGVTPRGNASSRLRSRSRTVQTAQRSRSRMDRSKSRDKGKGRGIGLAAVDEDSVGGDFDALEKPARHAGSKPEKKNRRGGRGKLSKNPMMSLETLPE